VADVPDDGAKEKPLVKTEFTMCGECGSAILDPPKKVGEPGNYPCPTCGLVGYKFGWVAEAEIPLNVLARAAYKVGGKGRPKRELLAGWDRRNSHSDYVLKERIIDREADRYREKITTKDGQVLRDVYEPLSGHTGHGSAKLKKKR
jgi:hypothetical protein